MTAPKRGYLIKQLSKRDGDGRLCSGMQIECSKCDAIEWVKVAGNMLAMPEGKARKVFQARGWDVRSSRAYCPECQKEHHAKLADAGLPTKTNLYALRVAERVVANPPSPDLATEIDVLPPEAELFPKEEPVTEAAIPLVVREPSREDKRRINAEIAGNWDDQKMRYIGSASDQSIADTLKLPRKWVEDIRVEFYGDSGANEDIDQLKRDLDFHIEDVEKLVTTTIEAVSKIDEKLKALKGMRERLERIEKSSLPRGRA